MSGQKGIDEIAAKQGAGDGSLDPNYHANSLQQVFDESNGHWEKIIESKTLSSDDYRRIDVFANDAAIPADVTLTLPPLSELSDGWNRDLYNDSVDTYQTFLVINAADGGGQLTPEGIAPGQGINFGLNEAGDNWILRDIKGVTPVTLDVVPFGDFNAIENSSKPSNTYFINGTGAQFSNYPSEWPLNPVATYTFIKTVLNDPSSYVETLFFYSTTDSTNPRVGQQLTRAGGNFGGAVAAGWKPQDAAGYFDYSATGGLALTTTPTILTGWLANGQVAGITELNGEFTVTTGGRWKVDVERIYQNEDNNPSLIVNVTILVEADDQQGGGFVPVLNRTAPISSATANDEPSILSFTSPAILEVTPGTVFRFKFSGEDDGGNPQDTSLIRCDIVGQLIG
jgi:hypothetical protein